MECEKVIPKESLDDLCSRFVINVPVEEQSDLIRICFQVELAHWFYIDFYGKNFPNKRLCGFKEFTLQIFRHIPFLQPFAKNIDEVIEEWKDYKFAVPTFGAIVLDEDLSHVLLVQNYKSCWGFPKGKVNKDEPPYQCAIREVYEETGFDIGNLINPKDYLEATLNERVIRLYVIPGVSKSEKFTPKTRNEIKAVNWFPISDIPLSKKDAANRQLKMGGTTSNAFYSAFYMVSPFVRKIRQWIYEQCNNIPHQRKRERHKSCSDIDKLNSLNLKESMEMFKRFQISDESKKTDSLEEIYEGLMSRSANSEIKYVEFESNKPVRNHSGMFGITQQITNVNVNNYYQSNVQSENMVLSSRDGHYSIPSSVSSLGNVTVSSELDSILRSERTTAKPLLDKNPQTKLHSPNEPWNINADSSARPLLSITSSESAFRKVEKTNRTRRKRRNKNSNTKESILSPADCNDPLSISSEKPQNLRKVIESIPSLLNFQFDISSILEGMNEAVTMKR